MMIIKATAGKRGFCAPVNDTLETLSVPRFRKSDLWPLLSSWICTSDQGIPLPNTLEMADGYAGVGELSCPFAKHKYTVFSGT